MRTLVAFCLLALAAVVAGCASDDGEATVPTPQTNETAESRNETFRVPLDLPASGPAGPTGSRAEGVVLVDANASGIVMEARWTCASPTCDVTFVLLDEEGAEVATASGSGDATFTVEAPANGTYTLRATPSGTVAGMQGEARAVVFYGEIPDGFSPFDEAAARQD